MAIHYAAENAHVDIVEELIQHGADVNALDDKKSSPPYPRMRRKTFRCCRSILTEWCGPES